MASWSIPVTITVFLAATAVITLAGTSLSRVADRLADRTGWGEATVGAILLGGSTSLSGIVVSITAASQGEANLAISNAIGGIAAQTAFIGIADCFYRRANLEHAAASLENIVFGLLVMVLLAGVLLAMGMPGWTFFGVHPFTPVLAVAYLAGLRLAQQARSDPMWSPRQTDETREDRPGEPMPGETVHGLALKFAVFAVLLGGCGWVVAQAGMTIIRQTGLSGTVVGALFTAIATSTPELVTSVAAVRAGALTLAVGGIFGGNAFDVMFAVAADVAYRNGSIYHAITHREHFLVALSIIMTGILILGMLRREKRGIGFEGVLVLVLYGLGVAVLALTL